MKSLFTSILLISFTAMISAQPAIEWQYSYGGTLKDGFTLGNVQTDQVANTFDGGYIIAGFSQSNDGDVSGHHGLPNTTDLWVIKLDSTGALEWQRSLGGTSDEYGLSVIQASDGNYVIAAETSSDDGDVTGYHTSAQPLATDFWIVKLDVSGNIIWEQAFGGTGRDLPHSVIETYDGSYVAAGRSSSSDGDVTINNGSTDIWIIKVSSSGSLLWEKSIGGSSNEYAYTIKQTPDNGFVISGDLNSTDGDFTGAVSTFLGSAFMMKLDSLATPEWFQVIGGNSIDMGFDIEPTPDGGYVMGVNTVSSDIPGFNGGGDYWFLKLDSAGSTVWQDCYGGSAVDWFKNFTPTPDGGYALIGLSSSADGDVSGNYGGSDVWVVKIDSLGAIEWEKNYGGSDADDGTSIIATPDGGLLLGVESNSNDIDVSGHHGPLSESDIWIAKLAPITTGIMDPEPNSTFFMVHPNPAKDNTVISFNLNKSAEISVSVYDITGRKVKELLNENLSAGLHEINADLKELNAGTYILKLNLPDNTISSKLVLTK